MDSVFEVQSLKDGRWMIEHRCRNEDEAIAEARELYETRHFTAVKVVKEMFDQAAKLYKETTVYRHPPEGQAPKPRQRDPGTPMTAKARPKPKKKKGFFDFLKD